MKFILFFILLFSVQFAYSQNNDSIILIDNVHGDNFYQLSIGDQSPTTMYLHFDPPEIPNYASIYNRVSHVSGWYINSKLKNIKLLGFLWSQNELTLYAPKNKIHNGEYKLVALDYDSVQLYEGNNLIDISEKFTFTLNGGKWTKADITKNVQGVNFYDKYLERDILLRIQKEDKGIHIINLHDLILSNLKTSKEALVGMNGFAETEIIIKENTFKNNGVNVLLEIMELGSCNTDRRSIMYITINNSFVIEDYGVYEIENCKRYSNQQSKKGNIIRIIPHSEDINYSKTNYELGSYMIVDSKVIILNPWIKE